MIPRTLFILLTVTLTWAAPRGALAKISKDATELREAFKAMKKWKGNAEKDCSTRFEVWVDLAPYGAYKYPERSSREQLLSGGYLGAFLGNFFTELTSVCRTFHGNKPSACLPKVKPYKKIIFRGQPKFEAKNADLEVKLEGDTLTLVYPPNVQWRTGLVGKSLYKQLSCDGNEALPDPEAAAAKKKAAAAKPKLVKGSSLKEAARAYKRWHGMAEKECSTKFEVWVDTAPYDHYKYPEGYPREKLLSGGFLGLFITNWFNEMRGACRTFGGNKPTTCVPVLQKFKKIVFRPHHDIEAKNQDIDLVAAEGTLKVTYPPHVQWQTELMAKTLYKKFKCSGSEAME